jgi:chromate reductase, NAD(P)H dehydrogenase (quinone)
VQTRGGSSEMSLLRHRHEVPEPTKIHDRNSIERDTIPYAIAGAAQMLAAETRAIDSKGEAQTGQHQRMTFHVLAVSGSLRAASTNTGLIRMTQRLSPAGLVISDPYPIGALPHYDGDLDTPDTLPSVCRDWRAAVSAADAVLWAAPEYNHGPSGVLKNAFDWASRPFGANSLGGLVSTVMTSAGTGGAFVQGYLVDVLILLGGVVIDDPVIQPPKGPMVIHADGTTSEPAIEALVEARLVNLLAHLTIAAQAHP